MSTFSSIIHCIVFHFICGEGGIKGESTVFTFCSAFLLKASLTWLYIDPWSMKLSYVKVSLSFDNCNNNKKKYAGWFSWKILFCSLVFTKDEIQFNLKTSSNLVSKMKMAILEINESHNYFEDNFRCIKDQLSD